MKAFKLLLICAVLAWFGVMVFVGNRIYQSYASADPLRSEKVELQKVRILKDIETLRVQQEQERQKTAVISARLARQERIEKHQGVNFAAVTLAMFWRLFPVLTFGTALTGGLVYAFTRRVSIQTPQISGAFPRRDALVIAKTALAVSNASEMGKALAFQHDISQQQIHSAVEIFKSLKPGRETVNISNAPALPAATEQQAAQDAGNVSFQQAVRQFQQGKILIGYDTAGNPVYFALKDFVSCAFGGGSGSGKTSKLRFLVAQMALSGVNVSILDAHMGNEQSLVDSLGNLASLPNVRVFPAFETAAAVETMLSEVQAAIQAGKPADAPSVYILDELRPLNRACEHVETLMDILSNEGRKYNQFGVFASQTWEAKMFKQAGSAARDACVLKMAARMPREQARTLFKDGDSARQVAKLARPEMYADSAAFSGVVTVPFCSRLELDELAASRMSKHSGNNAQAARGDVETVKTYSETSENENVSEVNSAVNIDLPHNVVNFPVDLRSAANLTGKELLTLQEITAYLAPKLATKQVKLTAIAEAVKADAGFLSKVIRGQKKLPEQLQQRLTQWILKHYEESQQA